MITILFDNKEECDAVIEFAQKYVCLHRSLVECGKYPPNSCDKCYNDNHIKAGIRIISPVDSTPSDYYNNRGGYPAQCKPRKGGRDSAQS